MDALDVVGGVPLEIGIPSCLLRKDHLPINDCGRLAVAAAYIEANAASIKVTTYGQSRVADRRKITLVGGLYSERASIDLFPHEPVIKGALAKRAVDLGKVGGYLRGPGNPYRRPALLPEQELEQPLGIATTQLGLGMAQ